MDGRYQRTLWYVPALDPAAAPSDPEHADEEEAYSEAGGKDDRRQVETREQANVIASLAYTGDDGTFHLPCLDIDFPVELDGDTLSLIAPFDEEVAEAIAEVLALLGCIDFDYDLAWDGYSVEVSPVACNVTLIQSSSRGHFHLYIDAPVESGLYLDALDHLALLGVIEEGYCFASVRRGMTFLRLTHNKHTVPGQADDDDPEDLGEPF